jgi:uncharacterized protein (DUF1330 family)
MSSYFIAQLQIYDEYEYKKYLSGFDSVFEKYDGKLLLWKKIHDLDSINSSLKSSYMRKKGRN